VGTATPPEHLQRSFDQTGKRHVSEVEPESYETADGERVAERQRDEPGHRDGPPVHTRTLVVEMGQRQRLEERHLDEEDRSDPRGGPERVRSDREAKVSRVGVAGEQHSHGALPRRRPEEHESDDQIHEGRDEDGACVRDEAACEDLGQVRLLHHGEQERRRRHEQCELGHHLLMLGGEDAEVAAPDADEDEDADRHIPAQRLHPRQATGVVRRRVPLASGCHRRSVAPVPPAA